MHHHPGMQSPDGPVAYILAYARNQTYYVDAATCVREAHLFSRRLIQERQARGEVIREAAVLVWFEQCPTLEEAQARAGQVRQWPLRWQRRLVEQLNPQWVCLIDLMDGLPNEYLFPVPEAPPRPGRPPPG